MLLVAACGKGGRSDEVVLSNSEGGRPVGDATFGLNPLTVDSRHHRVATQRDVRAAQRARAIGGDPRAGSKSTTRQFKETYIVTVIVAITIIIVAVMSNISEREVRNLRGCRIVNLCIRYSNQTINTSTSKIDNAANSLIRTITCVIHVYVEAQPRERHTHFASRETGSRERIPGRRRRNWLDPVYVATTGLKKFEIPGSASGFANFV